jgi:hypothetical protein
MKKRVKNAHFLASVALGNDNFRFIEVPNK